MPPSYPRMGHEYKCGLSPRRYIVRLKIAPHMFSELVIKCQREQKRAKKCKVEKKKSELSISVVLPTSTHQTTSCRAENRRMLLSPYWCCKILMYECFKFSHHRSRRPPRSTREIMLDNFICGPIRNMLNLRYEGLLDCIVTPLNTKYIFQPMCDEP